jgi:replicative DNA helicase
MEIQALESLLERSTPYSPEAETSLLGAMMSDNSVIGEILGVLDRDDFYRYNHRIIYEAIINLFDVRQPADLVTVKSELERVGKLEEAGGVEYLAGLLESIPNIANAPYYARVIREKAQLRNLIYTCSDIIKQATYSSQDAEALLDEAERRIFEAVKRKSSGQLLKMVDILSHAFRKITDIRDRKNRLMGLSTGFYQIDDIISGLQPSHFIVIAGRPSMGKTSMVIRLAEHVGMELNKPVLFFSLEMTGEQIAQIMLCSHCRISPHNLRRGIVSDEEFQRLLISAGRFHNAPIYIDDNSDLSILELRARSRRAKAENNVELIIIDYLQRLNSSDRRIENRQQEIAMVSGNLKGLAKELQIPIVAVAQLNRAPESRDDHQPRLADLRESGAIEQDADIVIMLNRDEVYNPDTERRNICDVFIAKNRTGPVDRFELAFLKEYMRFENLAYHESTGFVQSV